MSEMMERVLAVLTGDWQRTRTVAGALEPPIADEHNVNLVRDALSSLAQEGKAEHQHGVVTSASRQYLEWRLVDA